jgi:serine/threonine protein kinase
MPEFARDEESAHDHELVLDDELLQEEESALRSERVRRVRSRLGRSRSERSDELTLRRRQYRVGDVLADRYRIERIHTQGTVGVTVEAEHLQLGQRVVLKLLPDEPRAHSEAVARFLRGARAAVQLKNQHVSRVIDVGTLESGAPYMVTEHLSGSDLRGVLRVREWLPVPEAVDYVLQACEALAEAHGLGFVHRNLKLSNLFLARRDDGRPSLKVLDFCVSAAPLGDIALGVSGARLAVSSLAYLAPEQIREPDAVDLRADIWALGAVLHELLTGLPLYSSGTAPGLFAAIAADAPTLVSHLRPEVPAELESVVLRCLEKAPEDRFADVGELARQLKPFASTEGRDSVERIVLLLERRVRSVRSARPPALPPARSIVRVPAAVPAAEPDVRRKVAEYALIAFGVLGFGLGIGGFISLRNLQATLAARTPERSVVASLSPALTAPPVIDTAAAPVSGAAPPPVHAIQSAPAKPAAARPVRREQHVVIDDSPYESAPPAQAAEPNPIADAKSTAAAAQHGRGLFDGAD